MRISRLEFTKNEFWITVLVTVGKMPTLCQSSCGVKSPHSGGAGGNRTLGRLDEKPSPKPVRPQVHDLWSIWWWRVEIPVTTLHLWTTNKRTRLGLLCLANHESLIAKTSFSWGNMTNSRFETYGDVRFEERCRYSKGCNHLKFGRFSTVVRNRYGRTFHIEVSP